MSDQKLKPLFLVKPGSVSRVDIRRAERLAGVCIIECTEPDSTRYSEPPLGANLDDQARAALSLMRIVINSNSASFQRSELTKWFVAELLSWNRPRNSQTTAQVAKS